MTIGLSASNLANKWLDVIRGGGVGSTFTAPAAVTVRLHTGDPGSAGTANISVGNTTKNAVTQGAAAAGVQANSTPPSAWTNGGTSETISHVTVWDGTTFLYSAALTASQPWGSGNTFSLTALGVSLSPIAA